MEIVPRKENSYWKHDQVGVRPRDRPVAFYSFVRLRELELGSNTSPLRILEDDPEETEPAWEGPCLMADLCGGESCAREMQPIHWSIPGGPSRGCGEEAAVLPLLPTCRQPAL